MITIKLPLFDSIMSEHDRNNYNYISIVLRKMLFNKNFILFYFLLRSPGINPMIRPTISKTPAVIKSGVGTGVVTAGCVT